MTTGERIIEAAASLLDSVGESAVTLRAVGLASGISHNAPYKHFKDRSAVLAAVATRDFGILNAAFVKAGKGRARAIVKLRRGLHIRAYVPTPPIARRLGQPEGKQRVIIYGVCELWMNKHGKAETMELMEQSV